MKRLRTCVAARFVAAGLIALAGGCSSQTGTAWSPFGPPTIPPPGAAQGTDANGYYPSPFVTPPPFTAPGTSAPTFQPSGPLPPSGMGHSTSSSADGLSWQSPRTGSASPIVATRGAAITRAAIANPSRAAEEPIRIVQGSSAGNTRDVVEISQLPKPRGSLGPIPALPAATTPATSRTRGYIPALPQQNTVPSSTVPANAIPPASAPPTTARPRYSSSAPAARYDAAVAPVTYTETADPALRWRRR